MSRIQCAQSNSPASDVLCGVAGVDQFVERVSFAAILQPRTAIHAEIVMMAVGVAAIKFGLTTEEEAVLHLRTAEAQERFSVAVRYLIWPIASIALRIEGQTFRTIEHVASTVYTVHELTTMLMVADLEVTVLMRTVWGRVRRFWKQFEKISVSNQKESV